MQLNKHYCVEGLRAIVKKGLLNHTEPFWFLTLLWKYHEYSGLLIPGLLMSGLLKSWLDLTDSETNWGTGHWILNLLASRDAFSESLITDQQMRVGCESDKDLLVLDRAYDKGGRFVCVLAPLSVWAGDCSGSGSPDWSECSNWDVSPGY